MKKPLAIAILILAASSISACSAAPTPMLQPGSTLPAVKVTNKVVAEGKVVPVKGAALSFQAASAAQATGTVAEILVNVGDRVDAGQVLMRLDTKQLELSLAQAEANYAAAQAKFAQLKRGATTEDVNAAQQSVKSAQAAYDNLLRPPQNDLIALKSDLDKAKAQVDRAQAAYDRIGGDSNPFANMTMERAALQTAWLDYQKAVALYNSKINPSDAQIQQALAAVQTAKSNLAKLTPTAEDLAATEANANAAKAARDLAADGLSRAKLIAPFAGIVVAIDPQVGETVAIGTPVVRVADTSNFQVETTDLTEINVVNVKEGDPATVTLDAIPDLELTGKVASIKGFGENRQGDIVYAIVVKLDKQDARLRWNMTAKVTIAK
ncbi:MAG: efflux RND transporter periplasmic adaptor subunit [Chloroflexota bacterium]|nr:efflux RND transporter periplasmic adaptor subunit [Chloroflexota bacterium]